MHHCFIINMIMNKVINLEYHKKNITKISFMLNKKEFTLPISPFKCKNIILNGEKKIIKTSEHDSQTIQSTINNINPNINSNFIS